MRTGKLSGIPGYVAYRQTPQWARESAAYEKEWTGAYIGMAAAAIVAALLAGWAFQNRRILLACAAIAAGLAGVLAIWGMNHLLFYNNPHRAPSPGGGGWIDEHNRAMTYVAARQLAGREPAGDSSYEQIDSTIHLLASPEGLLIADMEGDRYWLTPAAEVGGIRKLNEKEVRAGSSSALSLIPRGLTFAILPFHETGHRDRGPFEIGVADGHPFWIVRDGPNRPRLDNDAFMEALRKGLRQQPP